MPDSPQQRLEAQASAIGASASELDRIAKDPLFKLVTGDASPTGPRGRRLKVALDQIGQLAEEARDIENRIAMAARSLQGAEESATAAELKAEAADLKEAAKALRARAKAAKAAEAA